MELRHLRYLVAVAELGSISRAAQKLFIAQPPLSLQIKQLEDEVGTPLLIRYPRGVRLSPAGATFLAEARDIEILLVGCGRDLRPLPAALRSVLRDARISADPMSTGAAVRTYNVLLAEDRAVAAALIAVD